jgi:hypothetical protein
MEILRGGKPMHRKVQQGLKNWMDAIKKVRQVAHKRFDLLVDENNCSFRYSLKGEKKL